MISDIRLKWFAQLASLTYPASPGQAAEAFKAYFPLLSDMPDASFTPASLEAVVLAHRKMAIPSYDEVRKPLAAWWMANRPPFPALPAPPPEPERATRTPEETEAVARLARQAIVGMRATHRTPTSARVEHFTSRQPGHVSDGVLLATYEAQAKQGNAAAAVRAEMLRAQIGSAS